MESHILPDALPLLSMLQLAFWLAVCFFVHVVWSSLQSPSAQPDDAYFVPMANPRPVQGKDHVRYHHTAIMQGFVDKMASKLSDHLLRAPLRHHTGVDDTMLEKPSHLGISGRTGRVQLKAGNPSPLAIAPRTN